MSKNPSVEERARSHWQESLAAHRSSIPQEETERFREAVQQKIIASLADNGVDPAVRDTMTFAWGTQRPHDLFIQMHVDEAQLQKVTRYLAHLIIQPKVPREHFNISFPTAGLGEECLTIKMRAKKCSRHGKTNRHRA